EATIHTVEHVLAAVAAHAIDDLTIELTGPEPPILDGSVQPYFEALARAEPAAVGGESAVLMVTAPFTVTDKDATYIVAPAKMLRSEEHTSELQSRRDLVCRLLLEKKKQKHKNEKNITIDADHGTIQE